MLLRVKLSTLNLLTNPLKWLRARVLFYFKFNLEWISVHHPNLESRVIQEVHRKEDNYRMMEISDVMVHVPSAHTFVQDLIFARSPKLIKESTYWDPIQSQFAYGLVPKRAQIVGNKNELYFPISNPSNYFHWMIDELPWLLRAKAHSEEIRYVHSRPLEKYKREILDFLGIRSTKTAPWIEVPRILVPAFRQHSGEFSRKNIEIVRKTLLQSTVIHNRKSRERIYVSRRKSRRSLKNELRLEEYLRTNGFEILFLEEMSFLDQTHLFQSAEYVMSPHGAALANLIFCRKGTKVVEIFDPTYSNPCFRDLSEVLELRHEFISYSLVELEENFANLFPFN